MKINVPSLNGKKSELNTTTNEHKVIYTNFKEYLINCDFYWDDPNSDDFFNLTKLEQLRFEQTTAELKSLLKIYDFLVNKYGKYGQQIFVELTAYGSIMQSFQTLSTAIDNAVSAFNSIDTSLPEGAAAAAKVGDLLRLKTNCKAAKTEVSRVMQDMIQTENTVAGMAGGLSIENIRVDDIELYRKSGVGYQGEGYGQYIMDKTEIKKYIDLMIESNTEENAKYNVFSQIFGVINSYYTSKNSGILQGKCRLLLEKLNVLLNYHINDVLVCHDCREFYLNAADEGRKTMKKIEGSDIDGDIGKIE